jgi:hypothetical protein
MQQAGSPQAESGWKPDFRRRGVNFLQNFAQAVAKIPFRIMLAEFPYVADPPAMVAEATVFHALPGQFSSR